MTEVAVFENAVVKVRDILRAMGITGMESMRHICLYMLSRYITRENCKKFNIPEQFAWENMLDEARNKEGGVQFAWDHFFSTNDDCLINHFDRIFETQKFSFDVINVNKHKEILEIFDPVNLPAVDCKIDILGWIYEQHLKTGSASGRDLGQFFTDRSICEYMVELCSPGFKSPGVPESVCDPTMGTGGFLTAYVKYFKKHHQDVNINWTVQQQEIHGYELDQRVVAVARLNLFMEMKGNKAINLQTGDSLRHGLDQIGYDVILANMPFGVKGIKHAECHESVKNLKIRGTKSEPLFLQLIMTSLNQGGRAAVIVPDGILNNTSTCHVGTRKYLLENFELDKVIKLSGQFFMNTSVQSSILFFRKTGHPTKETEFLEATKDKNNSIISRNILTIDRSMITEDSSLDIKKYTPNCSSSIATNKHPNNLILALSDVIEFIKGKKRTVNEATDNGKYTFITCSIAGPSKIDVADFNREAIIINAINGNGKCKVYYSREYSTTSNNIHFTIKHDCNIVKLKYLYIYLDVNIELLENGFVGSNQKKITKEYIKSIKVPIPSIYVQEQIINAFDNIYKIIEDIPSHINMIKSHMCAIIGTVQNGKCHLDKLSTICTYQNGKSLDKQHKLEEGQYNVMAGGTKYYCKTNKYNRDGHNISISKSGTAGFVAFHCQKYWASDCFTLHIEHENTCIIKYLYYYLKLNNEIITSRTTGSTIPHCKWDDIKDLDIPIPPIELQQQIVSKLDYLQSQIESLQSLQKQCEENAKFMLESYLTS